MQQSLILSFFWLATGWRSLAGVVSSAGLVGLRGWLKGLFIVIPWLVNSVAASPFVSPGPMVYQLESVAEQPLGNVSHLLQDDAGFVWLATNSGLVRYDGHRLKNFPHPLIDGAVDHITDMKQDQYDDLWLISKKGILLNFSLQTGRFKRINLGAMTEPLASKAWGNTLTMTSEQIWLSTGVGVFAVDLTSHQVVLKNTAWGLPTDIGVSSILWDQQNSVWVATQSQGLYRYHLRSQQLDHYRRLIAPSSPTSTLSATLKAPSYGMTSTVRVAADDGINTLFQSKDGHIWLGDDQGLHRFDPINQRFIDIELPLIPGNRMNSKIVRVIFEDSKQRLWVGSQHNGLSLIYPDRQQIIAVNPKISGKNTFNSTFVVDIMEDENGILWFAGIAQGLYQLNPDALAINHYLVPLDSTSRITATLTDGAGQLWVGTRQQLYRYDPLSHDFVTVNSDIQIIAIAEDKRDGTLILVTNQADGKLTLVRFDSKAMTFTSLTGQGRTLPERLQHGLTGVAAIDSQGNIWLGRDGTQDSRSGLLMFDSQGQFGQALLADSAVSAILTLPGHVVVASRQGCLNIYNTQNYHWSCYEKPGGKKGTVFALYQDKAQRQNKPQQIWIATKQQGLGLLDVNKMTAQYITKAQGLPNDTVRAIVADQDGMLWLDTVDAISRFDPQTHNIKVLNKRNGLRMSHHAATQAGSLASGEVSFGSADSLVIFSPKVLKETLNHAHQGVAMTLSDLKIMEQSVPLTWQDESAPMAKLLNYVPELTLEHDQSRFSFSFAKRDYYLPQLTRYSYKMDGLSSTWMATTESHVAFADLPAGHYVFNVRASDVDGGWQENIRSFPITVKPAFWQTNSAYFMYLLSAVMLGFMLNSVRAKRLKMRATLLEQGIKERTETISQLLDEKIKLFANISHEFRTPLTLILGPLDSLLQENSDPKSHQLLGLARANAMRLLTMVNQLLDISRLQNLNNEVKVAKNVLQTCEFFVQSYRSLADKNEITLTFDCHIDSSVYVLVQADTLEKILSNLLSNALKYSGPDQQVTLSVAVLGQSNDADPTQHQFGQRLAEQQLAITVTDTGIGISPADQKTIFERFTRTESGMSFASGSGIGLALVKQLVTIHKGTISVISEVDHGSQFKVLLPGVYVADLPLTVYNSANEALVLSTLEQVKYDTLSASSRAELEQQQSQSQRQMASDQHEANVDAKMTILLIEDNAEMRHYISDCLIALFNVIIAVDGQQGVEMAHEHLPDLIISDVMMPKMNGFEVTKAIRQDPNSNHIPIVLLTAHGDLESRLKGWSERADEYLEKPFNTNELICRIENLLSIRKILRQRYQRDFTAGHYDQTRALHHLLSAPADLLPGSLNSVGPAATEAVGGVNSPADRHAIFQSGTKNGADHSPPAVNPLEQAFFNKLNQVLADHYHQEGFTLDQFASEMALSSRQFGRKLKAMLDLSPIELLRSYRLNKAAELLLAGHPGGAVAFEVGFTSHSYFSQCFKAQYECSPTQYVEMQSRNRGSDDRTPPPDDRDRSFVGH